MCIYIYVYAAWSDDHCCPFHTHQTVIGHRRVPGAASHQVGIARLLAVHRAVGDPHLGAVQHVPPARHLPVDGPTSGERAVHG